MKVTHTICDACNANLIEQPIGTMFSCIFHHLPQGHALHDFYLCPACLKTLKTSLKQRDEAKSEWARMNPGAVQDILRDLAAEQEKT